MRVYVYAICKNESKFTRRWMDSMREADGVFVLDTGSEDGTAESLRALGAAVEVEPISPWRFDTARNRSLELVPEDADICICTDLDELLHPGWRALLEAAWTPGTSRAAYRYTWNFNPDGSEGFVFWTEKAHSRHGYKWTHPVHEVLTWIGPGREGGKVYVEGMQLDHRADDTKSRAQYLPLLELSVLEDPEDDRNLHYLGREYYFHGRWQDAITTLERHLTLPNATWLLALKAAALPETEGNLCIFEPGLDAVTLRELVNAGVEKCSGICAAFSGADGDYKYVLGSKSVDLRAESKAINAALKGRGGGSPAMIQGSCRAARREIEEFFGA